MNVLFPEAPLYFLGLVGRQKKLYRKSMKIIQNSLKIEEKFSDVPKKFGVGPKKVGSVGFPETRHFYFVCLAIHSDSFYCIIVCQNHFVQIIG